MAAKGQVSVGAVAQGVNVYMTPVEVKVHFATRLEEQNPT